MSASCRFEGCTVDDTGKCALENDPVSCPNRLGSAADLVGDSVSADTELGSAVLEAPEEAPRFPSSGTLTSATCEAIMASRYVTVVGILGEPESGKTACLVSLYLQISNNELAGWSFADSQSLMGFEDIARGARRWNEGHPPEQMTVHTELADERQPGFLHLRLCRETDKSCIDLALPDLPGEWTKGLIRSSQADRFQFLKSSDVIWLVVDGRTLIDRESRQGTITRIGQLAGRLRSIFGTDPLPRLLLVLTHRDVGEVPQAVLEKVSTELFKHGTTAEVIPVAPFTDDEEQARPGFGIDDLINATAHMSSQTDVFWPSSPPSDGERAYSSFRAS